MSGITDLELDVTDLRQQVADFRRALAHALEVATHERRMRAVAEDAAAHAWRVVTTWPRRAERGATDR